MSRSSGIFFPCSIRDTGFTGLLKEERMKTAYGLMAFLLVAACSGGGGAGQGTAGNETGTVTDTETATNMVANAAAGNPNPATPAKDIKIERKDAALEFEYEWPEEATAIAPLHGWLGRHAEDRYKEAHAAAAEGQKLSKEGEYPFRQYSYAQSWDDAADTPDVLVLEGEGYSYTGGAHGMPFYASLIWDKQAGKRRAIKDVLDISKLAAAAKAPFCKALDAQRAKKREGQTAPGLPEFSQCPDMAEQEIILVSDSDRKIDGIKVIIGPYVAGPYAEGSYEIELPFTAVLRAAVKPAYGGWFAAP